ncbi:hypothetical protein [Paractinoplanes hotanensis]|uniref:STAS domain-containing protein n=1 Tax=Paractinoplanes hotanensis TaxID=2906497 RepID=A0ABT0YDK0_9ACTN|nr:hypothetical protein [Actinoplanes hotanensis]MCM4084146.1 hypothetical protein [Actinoplanes hotanensis]
MDDLLGWRHTVSHRGRVCTICLDGELDMAAAPTLQSLFYEQLQAGNDVRVDLVHRDAVVFT